jgi:hypothetical protein
MGRDDQKTPSAFPSSLPPETSKIDSSWDDDLGLTFPIIDAGDEGERITAVPDVPMSDLARDLMAEAESEAEPKPTTAPPSPSIKDSLRAPHVPVGLDDDVSLEYSPESSQYPGRAAAPPPEPGYGHGEFGGASFANSPTEPPLSEDPLPSTARGAFDFDDAPRAEMPTLDISEGVDHVLGSSADDNDVRDTTPDEMVLDLSDFDASSPPTTQPSPLPRLPIGEKTGLELDDRPPPVSDDDSAHKELHDRYAVGDFTGALVIADSILEQDPEDIEAKRYSQSCRDVLMQMYSARLGSGDQVVSVAIPPDQIRWLSLDHRAGFLLSLVDGSSSVDDILDICGMPRLDALRILYQLLEQRVITVS